MKGRDHLEELSVDGKIILEWILDRVRGCGLEVFGLGQAAVAGCSEHGNEPSGSIKGGEFLE
jgi:hypothetical protein